MLSIWIDLGLEMRGVNECECPCQNNKKNNV